MPASSGTIHFRLSERPVNRGEMYCTVPRNQTYVLLFTSSRCYQSSGIPCVFVSCAGSVLFLSLVLARCPSTWSWSSDVTYVSSITFSSCLYYVYYMSNALNLIEFYLFQYDILLTKHKADYALHKLCVIVIITLSIYEYLSNYTTREWYPELVLRKSIDFLENLIVPFCSGNITKRTIAHIGAPFPWIVGNSVIKFSLDDRIHANCDIAARFSIDEPGV